jgi:hypothetical protein
MPSFTTFLRIFAIILHCLQLILSLTLGGKSSKSASATTSPIKDTIRGSQEMIKKLMSSKDRSGLSSSSSEKVCIFGHFLFIYFFFFENLIFLLLASHFGYSLVIFRRFGYIKCLQKIIKKDRKWSSSSDKV